MNLLSASWISVPDHLSVLWHIGILLDAGGLESMLTLFVFRRGWLPLRGGLSGLLPSPDYWLSR